MGRWNSVLNLMHLFAQERGRGYGQSLMEGEFVQICVQMKIFCPQMKIEFHLFSDGSVAAERVGGERVAWEDADS